ncbi:MAG: Stk1 family PASTA domain-containing Ser/Thr kinase, partial [Firmicutes bacterium]|nr:Stk1 family PASTA domain-containing Ser/Thr kinase [Bacillota bacterium]
MEGEVLSNRYEIEDRIGEGGMALVYRAKDRLLHRWVAVKILREQYASDEDFVERFRREAQAAASLSHPNVVNIYDVGEVQNTYYIVMEYVRGINLKELIRKEGKLTPELSVDIALQVAAALGHAHRNHLVHRDIKPHNILITDEGRVKVTDFGIARAVSTSTLTQTGLVIGSVHYFSPEQARGGVSSEQSDIYSLGIVLYEMLTGTVPFTGETPIAVALQQLQDPVPSPRKLDPSIPKPLEDVILKALAKEPQERFRSAEEFIQALQKTGIETDVSVAWANGETGESLGGWEETRMVP